MDILNCTNDDVKEIKKIEDKSFSGAWSEKAIEEEMNEPTAFCVSAREEGILAGYAFLSVLPPEAELLRIAVAPEKRGRGTADILMKSLFFEAKKRGIETVFLEVREDNAPARRLYEKHGFTRYGVRKKYYEGTFDAVLYKKEMRERSK